MLEWIAKYWIEVLFGLIVSGFGFFVKSYVKLIKKQQEDDKKAMKEEIKKQLQKNKDEWLQADIEIKHQFNSDVQTLNDTMKALTKGILSIQGRQFRQQCRYLLAVDHVITVEEYEEFENDYAAYKGLGGNHTGDALHDSVVEKFHKQTLDV